MTATEAQINRVRRWVDEDDAASTLTNDDIRAYIEDYPLPDTAGLTSTDSSWVGTYDLNAAAAELWGEKVAKLATTSFDFSADGGSYSRSQAFTQAKEREGYYRSRRVAISRATVVSTDRYNGYKLPQDVVGRGDTLSPDSQLL